MKIDNKQEYVITVIMAAGKGTRMKTNKSKAIPTCKRIIPTNAILALSKIKNTSRTTNNIPLIANEVVESIEKSFESGILYNTNRATRQNKER